MVVINLRDQEQWSETTLAKRSLAWAKKMQVELRDHSIFDFSKSIERDEEIIRSFMQNVRDQQAA